MNKLPVFDKYNMVFINEPYILFDWKINEYIQMQIYIFLTKQKKI